MSFGQEALPGLSRREQFEAMTPDGIVDHIVGLGGKVDEIKTEMDEASTVLEGAYGVTVEQVLADRQLQDTQEFPAITLFDAGENNGTKT